MAQEKVDLMLKIFVAFLLVMNLAFAFDVKLDKETLIAPLDTTGKADITFYGGDESIVLSLVGEKPWMLLTPTQFTLSRGENITVSLFASPRSDTPQGLYRVRILAESLITKEKKSTDLFISVEKESGVYIERVLVSGELEPASPVTAEFHLRNFGSSTVNDVLLSASTSNDIFGLSEKLSRIDPSRTRIIEKTFMIPAKTPPGEYAISTKLSYQDITRNVETKFVVPERAVIKKDLTDYSPFVTGYSRSTKITNYGNKQGDYTLREPISNFDAVFYSGTEPSFATDNEYGWKIVGMKPGDTVVIAYKVDYMPLILFLLAILVFSWYILVKLRTVRITKFIMQKRMIEEGAEFTIGLDVKNASGANVDEVLVRDFVPSVFEVKEAEGPKPVKRKTAHGTELEWKLHELFNKEERILSYKIIPVFGVSGEIALPTASAKFKFGNRPVENKSNVTAVGVASKEKVPTLEDIFEKKKKK